MWVLPLLSALFSLAFAGLLGRQFLARRRPHQAFWALALLMYAGASAALMLGALSGWTPAEFRAYWLLGAVLTVPYLAQGELFLLVPRREVAWGVFLVLVFATAFAVARVTDALIAVGALGEDLPSGKDVLGATSDAYRLGVLYSYVGYAVLVLGTLWSAWRMRGRRELRDRFWGTLLIALGATIVAGGSAFAAKGILVGFSLTLTGGIAVMFWGFLRASRAHR
ncbi:MAG: hypothetical protein HY658_06200 [Actinobacteria bacterium]|nr:hypothetical protein [Actinomycetota bacterium]